MSLGGRWEEKLFRLNYSYNMTLRFFSRRFSRRFASHVCEKDFPSHYKVFLWKIGVFRVLLSFNAFLAFLLIYLCFSASEKKSFCSMRLSQSLQFETEIEIIKRLSLWFWRRRWLLSEILGFWFMYENSDSWFIYVWEFPPTSLMCWPDNLWTRRWYA